MLSDHKTMRIYEKIFKQRCLLIVKMECPFGSWSNTSGAQRRGPRGGCEFMNTSIWFELQPCIEMRLPKRELRIRRKDSQGPNIKKL